MSDAATERRRRALAIFDIVADLAGEARLQQIDALCDGDQALREQVQALLDADAGTREPFSGDVAAWGQALQAQPADGASDPMLGRSIGAWRVREVIGRGGMGAVYAVERSDGAYTQQAALKLIRTGA